jgi:hypothetical protein
VKILESRAPQLAGQLEPPCRRLAVPTSRCLVRETVASGNERAILADLMRQQLGVESERIVKRCIAQVTGLPAGSLEGVPLRQLAERFGAAGR